jgi:hypothetical protein
MAAKSLLCLSSGLTPQYRLDILRLLALPTGTDIPFRYGDVLIQEGLRTAFASNDLKGSRVLLAHVDCDASARPADGKCIITPCRHAILVNSTKVGAFFFLQFRLEEFAPCTDTASFQNQIVGDRPHWNAAGEIEGNWCFESSVGEQACRRLGTLDSWQEVIRGLWTRKDFAQEPFFFAVDGLYVRGKSDRLVPKQGEFVLDSERNYSFRVFHFHPDGDKHAMPQSAGLLKIEVATPHLETVTTPTLPVDSPYDLKTFHLRTGRAVKEESAWIVARIEHKGGGAVESQPELFLPLKVEPARFKAIGFVILVAALIFAQQLLSATAKGPINLGTTIALVILALGTAVLVVFGIKKPV